MRAERTGRVRFSQMDRHVWTGFSLNLGLKSADKLSLLATSRVLVLTVLWMVDPVPRASSQLRTTHVRRAQCRPHTHLEKMGGA